MTTSRSKWVAAIAAGAFLAPVALHAQDTTRTDTTQAPAPAPQSVQTSPVAERTHVVKEGDTLWDLARQYIGDPFLWPEIYRLNTTVVEDPHWIYPGEVLNLPGAGTGGLVASGADEGIGDVGDAGAAAGSDYAGTNTGGGTIFEQKRIPVAVGTQRLGVLGRDQRPVVRAGEYFAAPFVVRSEGPNDPGEILRSADRTGISRNSERSRFQTRDQVFVELPKGKLPVAGDRYLAYRDGPQLDGLGRVIVPTAVVVVDRASPGEATLAHIDHLFQEVKVGQQLIPLEEFPMSQIVRPTPVERGPGASVAWVQNEPVLASLHQYLVLDAKERDGVRLGDQFTLYTGREEAAGTTLTARPIATVQVVRVTSHGTTAMVVGQNQPKIRPGTAARLTAKMP
jgi:LysM repeat protein